MIFCLSVRTKQVNRCGHTEAEAVKEPVIRKKRRKPGMRAWVSGCSWQSSVQTPEHLFSYPTHQHRVDGRKWLMN